MKNNIYGVLNVLTGRYGEVYSFPSDGMALYALSQVLPKTTGITLDKLQLMRIATVDIETGAVETKGVQLIPWEKITPIEKEGDKE